jgi:hypothetical protein
LVSTAVNLTPVSSGTAAGASGASGTPGSGTVTASAYAIRQLFNRKEDPLAPNVYNAHGAWRRAFFTAGREQLTSTSSSTGSSSSTTSPTAAALPKTTAASTTSTSTAQPGTIAGIQYLIVQKRDASSIAKNPEAMAKLQSIARDAAGVYAKYTSALIFAICGKPADATCEQAVGSAASDAVKTVQDLVDKLPSDRKSQVDQLVSEYVAAYEKANPDNRLANVITYLQGLPQFSVNFTTTQRTGGLPDDYLAELIYDRGLAAMWHFTANGSYDYSNSSQIGADLRTERVAIEFSRALNNTGASKKSPFQLNLSGEGVHQDTGYHYRAQLQLVVPVVTGVNFPLSFGYGNETDALRQEEKGVYGKFGFTFDFAKLVSALRAQQP